MKRVVSGGVAAAALVLLVGGCTGGGGTSAGGGSSKEVARVNKEIITEADFYNRLQDVDVVDLKGAIDPQGPHGPARAGDFAMQDLIQSKLIEQLGAERKALPTAAEVDKYVGIAKKYQTLRGLVLMDYDPFRTDKEWKRMVRAQLIFRNLVVQQVKMPEADLRKSFDDVLKKSMTEQDQFHLRVIDSATKAKAEQCLKALDKIPFETVALTQSEDPQTKEHSGDVGWVPVQQMGPALTAALKDLKPGEHTGIVTTKVASRTDNPTQPASAATTHYLIAQLVEKKGGAAPTFDDVKPLVENYYIETHDPGAFARAQSIVGDYRAKAQISVALKEYERIATMFKQSTAPTARPGAMNATGAMPGATK